jgi:hypothetical protein
VMGATMLAALLVETILFLMRRRGL